MGNKAEEKRILLSASAIPDERVAEMLLAFDCQSQALRRNSVRRWSWLRPSRAGRYYEAAEELCRIARKIVWRFVNTTFCCPAQIESASKQFAEAAAYIQPTHGKYPDLLANYKKAIQERSHQLHVTLVDFNDFNSDDSIDLHLSVSPQKG